MVRVKFGQVINWHDLLQIPEHPMFDLKELEAFATVIQSGSLTASARDLNLPKSTLSRRIRQLEKQLGQALLRRESNRLSATEAGRLFYRYCDDILQLARQGRSALDELQEEIRGDLVLRCHGAFTRGWFPDLVETFMAQHRGVRVVIHTQVARPCADTIDGPCLWLGQLDDIGLRQEPIGALSQGLYAQPDYLARHGHPEHPRELIHYDWVDLLGDSNDGLVLQHPREGLYPLNPPVSCLRVDQFTLQGDAIARGRGLGLLPHWLTERRLRSHPGTMVPCLPEWQGPSLPIWLIYPHGQLARRQRAFLQHLRASVPAAWLQPHQRPAN